MVESLYGRKTHTAQIKYEKGLFQSPYLHHRKVSGEPPNLRTIAESEDDPEVSGLTDACASSFGTGYTGTDHGRKPRAISLPLPTVYRDGSYLRIKVSDRFNQDRPRRRRFSEPAVTWSSTCHDGVIGADINHKGIDESETFTRNPRISVSSGSTSPEKKIEVQKRRHSDPLLYTTIKTSPDHEDEYSSSSRPKDEQNANNQYDLSPRIPAENIREEQNTKEIARPDHASVFTPTRRRKSSLVPIPFSVNKSTTRRQKSASKRRYSFPLSKSEEGQTSNLLELEKCSERHHKTGNNLVLMPSVSPFDFVPVDDNNEITTLTKEGYPEENENNCEKIITQWMKFFG